ncbi:MAG: hypothetical protein Q7T38_01510 [Gallionella sp.]|nr:hypothetical protein [Gallionella sp.]
MTTPIIIDGGQLNDPPSFAGELLKAFGFASMHWARLEQHLDVLLITLNKEQVTKEKFKPYPNYSWSRKLDFFEKLFSTNSKLSKYSEQVKKLVPRLRELGNDRNLLLHSNCVEFIEGPPLSMVAVKFNILKNGNIQQQRAEWTAEQIMGFAGCVAGLNNDLNQISQEVLTPEFLATIFTEPAQGTRSHVT